MKTHFRVLAFGVISGLIWSLAPGTLSELFRSPGENVTVIVAGMMSGIVTSVVIAAGLHRFRRGGVLLLGVFSLPLGAFTFGVLISLMQWLILKFNGPAYRFVENGFAPLASGASYAILSVISVFSFIFFPLAILSTALLRRIIGLDFRDGDSA